MVEVTESALDRAKALDREVGKRLQIAREQSRLSQRALGARVDMTGQGISKYETGRVSLSVRQLSVLAEILSVPVNWFFLTLSIVPSQKDATL